MKIFFVDDRPDEIYRQWEGSGCQNDHELLLVEPFESIQRTLAQVQELKPRVVCVGYGLGKSDITGVEVIRALRNGGYKYYIIANSGGGNEPFIRAGVPITASANRDPVRLKKIIDRWDKYGTDRRLDLKDYIESEATDSALAVICESSGFHESESAIEQLLFEPDISSELLDAAPAVFIAQKPNHSCGVYQINLEGKIVDTLDITDGFGFWVHSLSHFIGKLWERQEYEWLKKFYRVTFEGVFQFNDSNCADRLVESFARRAPWDIDPMDFFLTPRNLFWMDWKYYGYGKDRIEASPFESEVAFLNWRLHRPEAQEFENLDDTRSIISRLRELGADTTEFDNLEKDLFTKRLSELEEQLPAATKEWEIGGLERGIQQIRAVLANLP